MLIIPELSEHSLAIIALIAKDKLPKATLELSFAIEQIFTLRHMAVPKESSTLTYSSTSEAILKLISQNTPLKPDNPDYLGNLKMTYSFVQKSTALGVHKLLMAIVREQYPHVKLLDFSQRQIPFISINS